MVSRQFRAILSIFGVTYMACHWKISGIRYGSHHYEITSLLVRKLGYKVNSKTVVPSFVMQLSMLCPRGGTTGRGGDFERPWAPQVGNFSKL